MVDEILKYDVDIEDLDGFYFSYVIQHISKEFDLLKISKDLILNIELKSKPIKTDKIKKQLVQNRYYLSHLSDNIKSYTYISSSNELYYLDKDESLKLCDFTDLVDDILSFNKYFKGEIDNLFKAANFLISPLNTPEKFLNDNYFLTNQQEEIKNNIFKKVETMSEHMFISITGSAGTGKTLLLYDIAKTFCDKEKVCVIHCGFLSDGHNYLNKHISNIEILPIRLIDNNTDFTKFKYIFLDETQRIYENQFNIIINAVKENNLICVFSYDPIQTLSKSEKNTDIDSKIALLSPLAFRLTDKIRTNKELSSFILTLFNLNRKDNSYEYNNVDIIYASNKKEAIKLIGYFKNQDYTFINFTSSSYYPTSFDIYGGGDYNTHKVIGQEFDKVLMLIDSNFYYNERNVLEALPHPYHNYLYGKLLFQGITRTRERLCIIVIKDMKLFKKILSIKLRDKTGTRKLKLLHR